jgi:hypothetical protein
MQLDAFRIDGASPRSVPSAGDAAAVENGLATFRLARQVTGSCVAFAASV